MIPDSIRCQNEYLNKNAGDPSPPASETQLHSHQLTHSAPCLGYPTCAQQLQAVKSPQKIAAQNAFHNIGDASDEAGTWYTHIFIYLWFMYVFIYFMSIYLCIIKYIQMYAIPFTI